MRACGCHQGAARLGQASQRHVLHSRARCLGTDELTWSWLVGGSGCPWKRMALTEAPDACRDVRVGVEATPQLRNEPVATFPFRKPMLRRSEGHGETAIDVLFGMSSCRHFCRSLFA